ELGDADGGFVAVYSQPFVVGGVLEVVWCSHDVLLLSAVEGRLGHGEGHGRATDVDGEARTRLTVVGVDVGQRDGVAEGGREHTRGDAADRRAVEVVAGVDVVSLAGRTSALSDEAGQHSRTLGR